MSRLLQKKITLLLILIFTFSLNLGMTDMHTDDMGSMTDCPFMRVSVVCQMSPFEHIEVVRNIFNGLPVKSIALAVFSLTLIISFAAIPKINSPPDGFNFFAKEVAPLPNKILLALSDGRMQPKLYA